MEILDVRKWLVVLALATLAGCVTAAHPCISEKAMFSDGTTSCLYGRGYRCDDGDWIALRTACVEPSAAVPGTAVPANCEFSGISFPTGCASCQAGMQYRCEGGTWRNLDLPCAVGDAPIRTVMRGAVCSYRGATVASSSTICQAGTTYLCNDGQWVNLGTLCQ